jgi:DNA-binding NtrC family response regulator
MQRVRHLLILEDNAELAGALADAMQSHAEHVHRAATLAEARALFRHIPVDGILMDVSLPDGQADTLLDDIQKLQPFPHVIALSGTAEPDQAFRLAEAGVRGFIPKPVDLRHLIRVWQETLERAPALTPFVRSSVGRTPMNVIESSVRDAMVEEALARAQGSRRGAARLLQISRQLLQHIVRGK